MNSGRVVLVCGVILACAAAGARAANDGRADPDLLIDALKTYSSRDAAQLACGHDKVVWADRYEGFYYESAEPKYGATRDGSYACQSEARASRYWSTDPRASMDGAHPGRNFPFDRLFVGS